MSITEIHRNIAAQITADSETVVKRRAAIGTLAAALTRQKGAAIARLHGRRGVWLSTGQTAAKIAGRINVQVLGLNVGKLILNRRSGCFELVADAKKFSQYSGVRWLWSGSRDAHAIRRFLAECRRHPKASAESEREIQWQLAGAMRSAQAPEFRHLQPVTLNGRFAEVGVAVNRIGRAGTGNIDLLVRRGCGGNRGLLVFEIKGPREHDVEGALQQALRYAFALNHEMNTPADLANLKNYHTVLGSKAFTRTMRIGVVVVLEDSPAVRTSLPSVLERYVVQNGTTEPVDRVGVLLYTRRHDGIQWRWYADPRGS